MTGGGGEYDVAGSKSNMLKTVAVIHEDANRVQAAAKEVAAQLVVARQGTERFSEL